MTNPDITHVASDNAVTWRERQRQSTYRAEVLQLPAGADRRGRTLGNYLPADDRRNNFLSEEAAEYAAARADVVRAEGGQLEQVRLYTNMLSSMPLAFTVFGHLRAHPTAALAVARDDDAAARSAVADVDRQRGALPTAVTFLGHGEFADAAARVDELSAWAARFRRRYVAGGDLL